MKNFSNVAVLFLLVCMSPQSLNAQKLLWTSEYGGDNSNGAIISYDLATGSIETPVSLDGNPLYGFNLVYDIPIGNYDYDMTGGLTLGTDGNYYGVNTLGSGTMIGANFGDDPGGRGFFYRYVKSTGKIEVLHSFVGKQEWEETILMPSGAFANDLAVPAYTVLETSPGVFYGVATEGGVSGDGGVWKYDVNTKTYSVVGSFNDPSNDVGYEPITTLIKGDGNNIYGLNKVKSGFGAEGNLYKIDTSTDQLSFVSALNAAGWVMAHPHGQMVYNASENTIYGTKDQFDNINPWGGGVWSYDLTTGTQTNEWTILFSQLSTLGSLATGIVQGNDGFYYITTRSGGANGEGTIIKYTPSGGAYVKIFDFPAGFQASGTGMQANGTKIFGTCLWTQTDQMVWSYDYFNNSFQVHLNASATDPNHPGYSVEYGIIIENGNIIGKTRNGYRGAGAIFSHNINSGQNSILLNAASREGRCIIGELTQLSDSTFIGYVGEGGPNYSTDTTMQYEHGGIAIFNVVSGETQFINDPFPAFTFEEFAKGSWMNRPLIGSDGNIYYSKYSTNGFNQGLSVARHDLVNPCNSLFGYNILESNTTPGLFELPGGRFIMAHDDEVYEYDYINSTLLNIHTTGHTWEQHGRMNHNVMLASDGKIYGLTQPSQSGTLPGYNRGVLFSLDTTSFNLTVEHVFDSLVRNVNAGLTEYNGKLYGSTNFLGANNEGFLFSYEISTGTFATEHSFDRDTDGAGFSARWTLFNGKLYSTSRTGGQNGYGTLVEFDPSTGSLTVLEHLTMENGRSFRGTPVVWDDTWLGLEDLSDDKNIQVYPNPSTGTFTIAGANVEGVIILSVDGKTIPYSLDGNLVKMDEAPSGVYFLNITDVHGNTYSKKVIKE